MIATLAVIAEHAQVRPDGKLDVTGVYNCRYSSEIPARLDVTLALRFDLEPLDYGVHQRIAVHIMDEDSAEMVNVRASPISFESPKQAGLPLAYDLIVPLTVGFPREGTWTFDVRVNEKTVARVPLRVERR
ncbi:MAG TPA: hypothetical protein VIP11_14740 [Gemmatimonadaceae bacterium]